ncbi:LysR family transcriptional regulator [Myxococcota bacterium]|nr:LysR family transcriptional regulator [Myxococcota bacterium]
MASRSISSAWGQLPVFLAVAEHHSFTGAARVLGLSPSAVSQAVRSLEELVGAPLFFRTTRRVSLTEVGARLHADAGPAARQLGDALVAARTRPGTLSGSLRLTVPGIAVPGVVAPIVQRYVERHPEVQVEISVENRLVDLVAGRFDAGVRLIEATHRDMVAVRLSEPFRFVVVASPSYLRRRGVPEHPRALEGHAIVGFRSPTSGAVVPWDLERRGRVFKVPATGPLSTDNDVMLLEGALRGLGLAYVAEPAARDAITRGRLRVVLEEWAPEVPGFFLYYPSRRQASANLKAFVDCARELTSGTGGRGRGSGGPASRTGR